MPQTLSIYICLSINVYYKTLDLSPSVDIQHTGGTTQASRSLLFLPSNNLDTPPHTQTRRTAVQGDTTLCYGRRRPPVTPVASISVVCVCRWLAWSLNTPCRMLVRKLAALSVFEAERNILEEQHWKITSVDPHHCSETCWSADVNSVLKIMKCVKLSLFLNAYSTTNTICSYVPNLT